MATATAISGKIGKSGDHHNPARKSLTVEIPLGSEITAIRAYFANQPFGPGESVYKPTEFTPTPIVGLNGQPYAEWPSAWAYANFVSQSANSVTVEFLTWKHDNSRNAKLEVDYK